MASRPAPPAPSSRSSHQPSGGSRSAQKPRVGQYVTERTLGSGSFGKVKLATHAITGHQVALKFINRAKITTPDMNARVKREIQYLKVLRHPHIIKLYEVITTPTDVIMVMEYAGEELFNYIVSKGKGGMGEDEARRFFQQMIGALEYCHRHHIVHRDLKPENLFLDARQNIKIGDFGLSNLMTDGDFLKTSCGSPNYAAPEVISGRLYSGPEIDVWSAGVIMFVLLVGKLPFDDDHIPSLFKKIESGTYHVPSHVSADARHLLKRMLCVDPVKRATIAEIRSMPFFQENLPRYLMPLPEVDTYPTLPMDDMATLLMINEGQTDPQKVAEAKGLVYTEQLGILDPEIVAELLDRISAYSEIMVWKALQEKGDNQVKVAYQLVRDHKRILRDSMGMEEESSAMEEFMASSPPAWNAEFPRPPSARNLPQQNEAEENDWDEEDPEIQDIPNAHFDVLDTQIPAETAPDAAPTRPVSQVAPQVQDKMPKPKWHFGIRSRSPPMEVMLEIYKTLSLLGMQWKKKEGIEFPDIGPEPADGYPEEVSTVLEEYKAKNGSDYVMGRRAPPKKEIAGKEKAAQDLYLVKTRARYGTVMVRMDLQLYKVDHENYLVDFKNIGYYPATDAQQQSVPEANSSALTTRQKGTPRKVDSIGGVSGPFHFLEMACQLIAELAS